MATRGIGLDDLAPRRRQGQPAGLVSVCSAHPLVLREALRAAEAHGATALIEATCNQVNHRGGYTGLQPDGFARLVHGLAGGVGCAAERVVLGGDHLGPNPWRSEPPEVAMDEAEAMLRSYVAAGFRKLHLDCSMGCAGEPEALSDEATASRAARLVRAAEKAAGADRVRLRYVIGTEVPPPGGARHALDHLTPTSPEAASRTLRVHRETFAAEGLADALPRVLALVVQPGVEFGARDVIAYRPDAAEGLSRLLDAEPSLVFEAHSTDYQDGASLAALVRDGFAILKVGPELTFALREALYACDRIASELVEGYGDRPLMAAMETLLLRHPETWRGHVEGDEATQREMRHGSLSDRIRYLWPQPEAVAAIDRLRQALDRRAVPQALLTRHLPAGLDRADRPFELDSVVAANVRRTLDRYHAAAAPGAGTADSA